MYLLAVFLVLVRNLEWGFRFLLITIVNSYLGIFNPSFLSTVSWTNGKEAIFFFFFFFVLFSLLWNPTIYLGIVIEEKALHVVECSVRRNPWVIDRLYSFQEKRPFFCLHATPHHSKRESELNTENIYAMYAFTRFFIIFGKAIWVELFFTTCLKYGSIVIIFGISVSGESYWYNSIRSHRTPRRPFSFLHIFRWSWR